MSVASSGYDSLTRRRRRRSSLDLDQFQLRSKSRSRPNHSQPAYSVFRNAQGYTELNLSKKLLTVVPQEVAYFSRLEVLSLSHNALDDLPSSLARIRTLKILLVANNLLTHLPETITNLTHLVLLDLTHNKLTSLPQNLGSLRVLQTLKLGQNEFQSLPHDIGHLSILKDLDLHSNNLCYLPFTLQGLRKLKYLNAANNRFEQVPLPVCKIHSLKVLNFRGNNLRSLAPDFESLTNLRELNLSYNHFESVPTAVLSLSELKYLNLAGNHLKHVSHHLTCLQGLQVLHIQENRITSFPDGFTHLQYLNISTNQLTILSVVSSRRLKYLNLRNNNLESLPAGLFNLSRLDTLNLFGNKISTVSKDLEKLKKLKFLELGENVLTSFPPIIDKMPKLGFPPIIDKMPKLDYFNLTGNNIHHQMKGEHGHFQKSKNARKQKVQSSRMSQYTPSIQQSVISPRPQYRTSNQQSDIGSRSQYMHNVQQSIFRSRTPKLSRQSTFSGSHDLDELLLNGFSQRLLDNNYGSVMIRKRSTDELSDDNSALTLENHFVTGRGGAKSMIDISSKRSVVTSRADDDLFGIFSQLEMFLHEDFRDPTAASFYGKRTPKSSIWDLNENKEDKNIIGVVLSRNESFSVTEAGGNFISSVDSNVSLSIPPRAISGTLHACLKIIKIEKEMLSSLREENAIISNIISLGPIIFLKANKDTDFNHQVTMTIPSPKHKGHGHLTLLTIREDNSCIPSSSGFHQKHGYIKLNAWQLTGKIAVMTQAKCKYKACKSMETLLQFIEESL